MPELRTFPETLKYSFENVKGIVQIHFTISVEFSYGDTKPFSFYDILIFDHISLKSQYNFSDPNSEFIDFYYDVDPILKKYIRITVIRQEFIKKFKEYYMKFLKKHTGILKKYTKKYDPIATKHLKIIENNPHITKMMDKWIACALCYLTNTKGELKKLKDDVDGFFEKIDLHQEDKLQNPKVLLREMNNVFSKFPRYSKEFTVWRGLNLNVTVKPGDKMKNPMPFSTSLLPYTARGFLGNICCMQEITVPKNFPAIFLHKYRFWEKEVALPACELEVVSTQEIKREEFTKYLGDPDIPWIQQYKRKEKVLTEYIIIARCKILQK